MRVLYLEKYVYSFTADVVVFVFVSQLCFFGKNTENMFSPEVVKVPVGPWALGPWTMCPRAHGHANITTMLFAVGPRAKMN